MTIINSMKSRASKKLRGIIRSEIDKVMAEILPQLLEFHSSPPEKRQSFHDHTKDPVNNFSAYLGMRGQLDHLGVRVEDVSIDVSDFRKWLNAGPFLRS